MAARKIRRKAIIIYAGLRNFFALVKSMLYTSEAESQIISRKACFAFRRDARPVSPSLCGRSRVEILCSVKNGRGDSEMYRSRSVGICDEML